MPKSFSIRSCGSRFLLLSFLLLAAPLAAQESDPAFPAFPELSAAGETTMPSPLGPGGAIPMPSIDISIRQPQNGQEVAFSLQLLLLLTVLTLAPSLLILATCFLRLSIVLDFIKRALSLQQVPPTMVLNGIAFFMTLFIMWGTFTDIYTDAYRPMADGEITLAVAIDRGATPLRLFMFRQMEDRQDYIGLFMNMGGLPQPETLADVPTYALIPAYILHELTVAFQIGIMLYIPFIVIDMVVASVLMSMGMMMLPPIQISMPFKLVLFVLIDGWGLLTQQLFNSIA